LNAEPGTDQFRYKVSCLDRFPFPLSPREREGKLFLAGEIHSNPGTLESLAAVSLAGRTLISLRFKPDAEIGPSILLRVVSLSNELFGIFEMAFI
jgi:hypothetical protein